MVSGGVGSSALGFCGVDPLSLGDSTVESNVKTPFKITLTFVTNQLTEELFLISMSFQSIN